MKTLTKGLPLLALAVPCLVGCASDAYCETGAKYATECYEEQWSAEEEDSDEKRREEPKPITPDYDRR